jgi:hypothetical protein
MSDVKGQQEAPEDKPSDDELEKYVDAVDKVMAHESTRVAWLMGFLTGSALVDDADDPKGGSDPIQGPGQNVSSIKRAKARNHPIPGTA